ncbi:MAG: SDR family NAD(P)-dependent oxidoreductase [Actinomycetota bacterium]
MSGLNASPNESTSAPRRPIRRMLILGGGSEIAIAFAERCIDAGLDHLVLAGRAGGTVDAAASDMLQKHPDVRVEVAGFDATATASHGAAAAALNDSHGPFDTVVVAFGRLGEPFSLDHDPHEAAELIQVNFAGAVSSSLAAIAILKGEPAARLVVVSSIAAVRPRVGNLIYGSAKAGLDAFLTELRAPAADVGVTVSIVRPGWVYGRMTDGLEPAPFATTPAAVAEDMYAGVMAGKAVIHSPNALAPVGRVLRSLPGPLWRRIADR